MRFESADEGRGLALVRVGLLILVTGLALGLPGGAPAPCWRGSAIIVTALLAVPCSAAGPSLAGPGAGAFLAGGARMAGPRCRRGSCGAQRIPRRGRDPCGRSHGGAGAIPRLRRSHGSLRERARSCGCGAVMVGARCGRVPRRRRNHGSPPVRARSFAGAQSWSGPVRARFSAAARSWSAQVRARSSAEAAARPCTREDCPPC